MSTASELPRLMLNRFLHAHRATPRTACRDGLHLRYLLRLTLTVLLLTATLSRSKSSAADGRTSFESAPPGPFRSLRTEVGTWTVETGQCIVDPLHSRTGRQCLQLKGGEETRITLTLPEDRASGPTILQFHAERWTRRAPFLFRIEQQSDNGWKELYNGDEEVRVGRSFLSRIRVSFEHQAGRSLRFTCRSPPDTGILIDDAEFVPDTPQEIIGAEQVPFTLPALVGADRAKLAELVIQTRGHRSPKRLTAVRVRINGADLLESIAADNTERARISLADAAEPTAEYTLRTSVPLEHGTNRIPVTGRLRNDADTDRRITVAVTGCVYSDNKESEINSAASPLRLGTALRDSGDDGVHTYRIPGLATTNAGTLIAVYDVRHRSSRDLPGDIDVGMSRSEDGGRSWSPMQIIMDTGADPQWNYDGIGDPAVLVDERTGTIWVAAVWSHGNRSWHGSGPGLTPEETGQLMLVRSDDDGLTWSAPINITEQVKRPEWCFLLQGPGRGITMQDGTLVFAAQYQDPPNPADRTAHRLPHSTIIFSTDHGTTWQAGTGAFDDTTESQAAEIAPGVLMLNCRYNREPARVIMVTHDLGKTWTEHPTSRTALREPGACMASLLLVPRTESDGGPLLLFSNPDDGRIRRRITIRASRDGGESWLTEDSLLLDELPGAGYSCMTMIDDSTIGILYEGSQAQLTFQRIPLNEVLNED